MTRSVVIVVALGLLVGRDAGATPKCTLDAKKLKGPEGRVRLLALDSAFIAAQWDVKQGVVLTNLETGTQFGKAMALPSSPFGRVLALQRVGDGMAVVVRLSTTDRDEGKGIAGRLFVARFSLDGAPVGEPHEIAHAVAPIPMPGFKIVASGNKLVLLEETKLLTKSHVQVIDLDGKPLGPAVDAEAGRIGQASPIGVGGTALAVVLRDSEGGEERLRVFDVEKNAWLGPATPLGDWNIYGVAPFNKSALLLGVGNRQIAGATVGSDGKLGKWTQWKKLDSYDSGRWIASSPDGTRAYIEYEVRVGKKNYNVLATVQPNLGVMEDIRRPSEGFTGGDTHATASTLYTPSGDDFAIIRCKQ